MKKIFFSFSRTVVFGLSLMVLVIALFVLAPITNAAVNCTYTATTYSACSTVNVKDIGFAIPSLGDILTFFIRAFFAIAGISALFYLLLGAFAWITSGGDKDSIAAAREKIQAAIIGLILIVAVLALIWTLEQVVFAKRVCLGVSCPVTIPGLIKPNSGAEANCCMCPTGSVNASGANAGTSVVDLSLGEYCK